MENNPLIQFLNRVSDVIFLSVLIAVFSVPVFTIGDVMAAASYTVKKSLRGDDGYIWKKFWGSFKKNFRQAVPAWLITLGIGFVLCFDVYYWFRNLQNSGTTLMKVMLVISVILCVSFLMMAVNVFALLGNYENTVKNTFKNAAMMALTEAPLTFLILLIYGAVVYFLYGNIPLLMIMIFVGFGVVAYLTGFLHMKLFDLATKKIAKAQEAVRKEREEQAEDTEEESETDESTEE